MVIQKGSDLILELSVKPDKIRVYTTDTKVYIEITDFTDGKAYISSGELRLLGSGVIAYTYYIGKADQSFDDNQYDTIGVVYTDYYLLDTEENGDIHGEATDEIKEYVDKVISDKTAGLDVYKEKTEKNSSDIGELNKELDNETDRATKAETNNATNIETETERAKAKENELSETLVALQNSVTEDETKITKLSENVDDINETLKDKADKTELVNYLTKDDASNQYQAKGDYAVKTDIPTKTSELVNDSGYLTEDALQDEYALKTDIPTKTSQLTNDSGYLTEHQSLADYALKTDIPTKTSQLVNDSGYLTEHQSLADYALKTDIPTKTSQLTNDSGYLTEHQSLADYALKTDIPTKTSQLTNDSGYLTQHQDLSDYAKKVDYYTKTETDAKYQLQGDYITYNEMSEELADYALKTSIPTKTSQLTNDSGYLTQHQDISGKQDKLTDAQLANLNADHSKFVTSETATSIVKLTQSEYDALTTKDSSTIYLTTE